MTDLILDAANRPHDCRHPVPIGTIKHTTTRRGPFGLRPAVTFEQPLVAFAGYDPAHGFFLQAGFQSFDKYATGLIYWCGRDGDEIATVEALANRSRFVLPDGKTPVHIKLTDETLVHLRETKQLHLAYSLITELEAERAELVKEVMQLRVVNDRNIDALSQLIVNDRPTLGGVAKVHRSPTGSDAPFPIRNLTDVYDWAVETRDVPPADVNMGKIGELAGSMSLSEAQRIITAVEGDHMWTPSDLAEAGLARFGSLEDLKYDGATYLLARYIAARDLDASIITLSNSLPNDLNGVEPAVEVPATRHSVAHYFDTVGPQSSRSAEEGLAGDTSVAHTSNRGGGGIEL